MCPGGPCAWHAATVQRCNHAAPYEHGSSTGTVLAVLPEYRILRVLRYEYRYRMFERNHSQSDAVMQSLKQLNQG